MPLLRGGRAIGVLVVQNRTSRVYAEDEVEDLQIIAMVLAEMVAAGDLLGQEELKDVEIAPHRPERLKGARSSPTAWPMAWPCCTRRRWRPSSCSPTTWPPRRSG